jgi:hypothetical protein
MRHYVEIKFFIILKTSTIYVGKSSEAIKSTPVAATSGTTTCPILMGGFTLLPDR